MDKKMYQDDPLERPWEWSKNGKICCMLYEIFKKSIFDIQS